MHFKLSARSFLVLSTFFLSLRMVVVSQTPPPDEKPGAASISGRVTIDGRPAAGKKVLAADVRTGWGSPDIGSGGGGTQGRKYFVALTGSDGQYRFTGLPAGDYEVNVNLLAAYAPAGQDGRRSRSITLDDGEEARNIDFTLARGGVITGRLTDADGSPIIDALVLVSAIDNDRARSSGRTLFHNSGMTDDRGVYRIYGLPAGRYRLSADGTDVGPTGSRLTDRDRRYQTVYHPNVTDEKLATIVEVEEGNEVSGVDIKLGRKRVLYEVTGRVIDSETGKPPAQSNLRVSCRHVNDEGFSRGNFSIDATVDSHGDFRFAGLSSGRYSLEIYSFSSQAETYDNREILEVKQEKISGLEIKTRRGIVIKGVVAFDNYSNPKLTDWVSHAQISASITPKDGQSSQGYYGGASISADGRFSLSGLKPGRVTLLAFAGNLKPLPYILRVEKDGVEIKNDIEVKPDETVTGIRLVMTYGSGVIRGQVNDAGGKLLQGARFTITARHKTVSNYYGHARGDGKGQFVIEGLLDGEYEVEALVDLENGALRTARASQPAHVMAGAETQVTLTLDPDRK